MECCSAVHPILILLTVTFSAGSVSAGPPVKVELHGSATLPCSERCSGLARWTVFSKPSETLAECDQTSCRSVKEGYQMIHHQYLNGDLSLTISDTDFSKRGWYTCECDTSEVCDVKLQIEPQIIPVQRSPGESLLMKVEIPDPVGLVYNRAVWKRFPVDVLFISSSNETSDPICNVFESSLRCNDKYKHRVSLVPSGIELRDMKPSDSGVYIIRDVSDAEDINIYTVSIQDSIQSRLAAGPLLSVVLIAVAVALIAVGVAVMTVLMMLRRRTNRRRPVQLSENREQINRPGQTEGAEI